MVDLDESEIRDLFKDVEFKSHTEHTPNNVDELLKRVKKAADDGYVISRGFVSRGGSTITAPILGEEGKVVAVIDISGPDSGFNFDKIDSFYAPTVVAAADEISKNMGFKK